MLRFSSYSILSDPIPGGGYALLNGLSGAVDIVSDALGEKLREPLWNEDAAAAQWVVDELSPAVLASFRERGHLTELSEAEERGVVVEIAAAMHDYEMENPHFMIVPNMDCNYRCTYCFERPIQNAFKKDSADFSYRKNNTVMTTDHVGQIYDSIRAVKAKAGKQPGGQIILYGGEPLDRNNYDVVASIVERGRSEGYFFAAISNGHDLDRFIDLIGSGRIEQIQVSIDGPKEIHDKRRVYVGAGSSFDRIVENVDLVLDRTDAQVQIRVHVDPKNIEKFAEILGFFRERGWIDHEQVIIYANTVYQKDKKGEIFVEIDNNDIANRLEALIGGFKNVHSSAPAVHARNALAPAFEENKRYSIKGTYCSANIGNYIFAPDGGVYACWESVGKPCSRIGSYGDGPGDGDPRDGNLRLDKAMTDKWFGRSIATLPECQTCPYALVCGGGCAQYAEYNKGSLYRPYCDDFQRTYRSALAANVNHYLKEIEDVAQEPDGAAPTATRSDPEGQSRPSGNMEVG